MRKPIAAWLLYFNCTIEQFSELLYANKHEVLDDNDIRLWNRSRSAMKKQLRLMKAA